MSDVPLIRNTRADATGTAAIGIRVDGAAACHNSTARGSVSDLTLVAAAVLYADNIDYDTTTIGAGAYIDPLPGDRAVWDVDGYPSSHASDIEGATFGYHNDPANPPLSSYLGSGSFFVGNGSDIATGVTMSGDATLNNAGVITIAPLAIDGSNIAITNGSIYIGGVDGAAHEQSIYGDASLANDGTLTLSTVNADVGTYGDETHIAQITVNAKGLITAIGEIAFSSAEVLMADGITPPDPLTLEDQTDWLYEG